VSVEEAIGISAESYRSCSLPLRLVVGVQQSLYIRAVAVRLRDQPAGGAGGESGTRPLYLAGEWVTTDETVLVRPPAAPAEILAVTHLAGPAEYELAVEAAVAAERKLAALAAYERADALRSVAEGLLADVDEFARQLAAEAGKPLRDAVTEVERGALTFRIAAEEAERQHGEVLPLDLNAASRGRVGIVRRFPIGAIAAISPFNLPLGLAAHKVAPALAVGCPVVLKPPTRTPLTMLSVASLVDRTNLPHGSFSVLPMGRELGDRLVADERLKLLSFTGSPEVGWAMKARAGRKKVVLELGSNSAAIVDATGDLDWAAERCAYGAFKYGGQLCISVQRIFVHDSVWDPFLERFLARAASLRLGDPFDPATDVGPLIDEGSAERVEAWIAEAVAAGARVLAGGKRNGSFFEPTVLADVPRTARVSCEEAFGPVAVVEPFSTFDDALQAVNDSRFGLQAGVFTNDLTHAWRAYGELQVGGVVVNDTPTYRIDNMPFGGIKDSGLGREGVRYAMDDLTEPRLLVVVDRSGALT
jgi:acyl-CoA reductase-like NAD-dependent aldehyde dehydrogenase